MSMVMKSTDGKYYEVRGNTYSNGIGVETGVYYEKNGYMNEFCIDEVYCGRALLTCGNVPVCWLPESEEYYEKRKNRIKGITAMCRRFLKQGITDSVKLLENTDLKQGESFSGGCEVPYLNEVRQESVLTAV